MKITIKNLGQLQSATIDLDKRFLVFVGRNNTSKTYAAYTIYGLYKSAFNALANRVGRVLEGVIREPSTGGRWEIDVAQLVERELVPMLRDIEQRTVGGLAAIFASEPNFTAATQIDLGLGDEEALRRGLLNDELEFQFQLLDGSRGRVRKAHGSTIAAIEVNPDYKELVASAGVTQLLLYLFLPGAIYPLALSAERSAILLFSRELSLKRSDLVDALLEKAANAPQEALELVQGAARRYPLVIRDGLHVANDLANLRKQESPLAPLADRLEALLGGSVQVDDTGEMTFRPQGGTSSIRLHLSSSSVKSLAGLAFYLRHLAKPGGSLLIDEPELNLHPDNQRHVARILAAVARAGVHVLVTTHSDYFIRELNNLILLHRDDAAELRKKYRYDESETLAADDVGAYLFTETTAQQLDIARAGIEVKSIDDEINALNRISQDIYFSLVEK